MKNNFSWREYGVEFGSKKVWTEAAIETIIEKLIEDIPWYDERGDDVAVTIRELKEQLRAKWLGEQSNAE